MWLPLSARTLEPMATYLLRHSHAPRECAVAFAAWLGFESPLRHRPVLGTCPTGGHELWWRVEARHMAGALECMPPYVARRTEAIVVRPTQVP